MTCSRPAELIGIDDATLQRWLTQTQQAIQDLTTGGKLQTAAYTQGDGSKSVTYTQADIAGLRQRAMMLAQALGLVQPRRPMRPYFSSGRGWS